MEVVQVAAKVVGTVDTTPELTMKINVEKKYVGPGNHSSKRTIRYGYQDAYKPLRLKYNIVACLLNVT